MPKSQSSLKQVNEKSHKKLRGQPLTYSSLRKVISTCRLTDGTSRRFLKNIRLRISKMEKLSLTKKKDTGDFLTATDLWGEYLLFLILRERRKRQKISCKWRRMQKGVDNLFNK